MRPFEIFAAGLVAVVVGAAGPTQAAEIVELTQTGCQFLEPERVDHAYVTRKKTDCVTINTESGAARLNDSAVLRLEPGNYTFRVRNRDVPYELGFWLRSKGYDWRNPLHKVTKTSVSGGGLTTGSSQDYAVTLKPGEYLYSCPLNPTPDYRIIVDED